MRLSLIRHAVRLLPRCHSILNRGRLYWGHPVVFSKRPDYQQTTKRPIFANLKPLPDYFWIRQAYEGVCQENIPTNAIPHLYDAKWQKMAWHEPFPSLQPLFYPKHTFVLLFKHPPKFPLCAIMSLFAVSIFRLLVYLLYDTTSPCSETFPENIREGDGRYWECVAGYGEWPHLADELSWWGTG